MQPEQWEKLISAAASNRPRPATAQTFLGRKEGATEPAVLACDDGQDYVVKGKQAGLVIANDHIAGLLGRALGAPVPEVKVVSIPAVLVHAEPQLQHMHPGLAHGSRHI